MTNKSVIIILLLFGAIGGCSAIKGFELYMSEPTWGPSGLTWFQKNMTLPAGAMDVSVCMYLKIHHLYTIRNFIVVLAPLSMGVARWHGYAMGNVDQAVLTPTYTITFRRWAHVCFVIGMNLQLFIDGVNIHLASISAATAKPIGASTNFQVIIGMPFGVADPRQAATTSGYYTLPTVLYRPVTLAEASAMANCGAPPADNVGDGDWEFYTFDGSSLSREIVSLAYDLNSAPVATTTQLTTGDFASFSSNFRVFEFANTEVCPTHPDMLLIVFPHVANFKAAQAMCYSMGGDLIPHTDTVTIDAIFAQFAAASIQGALFLRSTSNPCHCLVYEVLSTLECGDQVTHVGCQVPYDSLLILRGAGLDKYVANTMYFYATVESNMPVFYSVNGWKIVQNAGYLDMYDVNGILAFTTISPAVWAVGRKIWRPSGAGVDLTLLLSMCNSTQFTCNNGLCISMDLRCDGKDDCNDDSDETCIYLLPLAASYKKDRPPDVTTSLSLEVTLVSVVDINVADNILNLWLKINSRWVDERVNLWLLNDDKQDNPVDSSVLWIPSFRLENAIFKDSLKYSLGGSSKMNVVADRVGDPTPILEGGYEGYKYNGILEKQEEFTLSYVCNFDLNLFPFGIYECRVNISIINSGSYVPVFNETSFQQISTPFDLSLFQTSELRYQFVPGYRGSNMLSLRLMVEAKFESYILTMFMPCWVIGVIGYLTLFYDKNNFSDRIMVTLSCLIVVAALLSQVSSTMPMSATSKAIDRFFLYFICRLFVVYIHHAGLFFVTTWVKKRKERLDNQENNAHPPVALDILENKLNFENIGWSKTSKITPSAAVYVPANIAYKAPGYLERRKDKDGNEVIPAGAKVRPWDDYYNWFGLIFGAIIDLGFAIMFIVEILNKRNEVYNNFYKD